MANVLDCNIIVSKFELQSHYYTIEERMNPIFSLRSGLNNTNTVLL